MHNTKAAPCTDEAARAQVVQGKRPTIDLMLRGAGDAAAPAAGAPPAGAPPAPGALLCGLVTQAA